MTPKALTSLYDEVLSDVPGATPALALNAIRSALIEFCARSDAWVVTADPIDSVANTPNYQFEPENGTEVVSVLQAWYNGVEIFPKTSSQLEEELAKGQSTFVAGTPWTDQGGVPKYYLIDRPDEFTLAPYPIEAIAGAIKMRVSLKPTRAATVAEKYIIDKYYEVIAAGAKARLCAMHSKPWSDPNQAAYQTSKFNQGVTDASAVSAFSKRTPELVTAPSPI